MDSPTGEPGCPQPHRQNPHQAVVVAGDDADLGKPTPAIAAPCHAQHNLTRLSGVRAPLKRRYISLSAQIV